MTTEPNQATIPAWLDAGLVKKYKGNVAHAFVLHQNVRDYVLVGGAPQGRLVEYLAAFLGRRDVVVIYDRAGGIQFPIAGHRDAFMKAVETQQGNGMDPTLAAALGLPSGSSDELPTDPSQALPLLDKLLRNSDVRSAVIVDYCEALMPSADLATMPPGDRAILVMLAKWGADRQIASAENVVLMVTGELFAIHPALRAASTGWQTVAVPLPRYEERLVFVEWYLNSLEEPLSTQLDDETIATATAGLSLVHIEDIFLMAELEGQLTYDMVRERKKAIVAAEYGDVLEFMEPAYGFEAIGGLEHVKNFFRKNVIDPMRAGNTARVPMGVLMTGPAGTGKSAVAVAVAAESGINAVRLQIGGKIASMWQGQGERNLEKALTAIKSLSPTLVFMDEIDQTVSRGGGAGGNQQDSRIFQRLLEFMSDTTQRGKVVFLAATNRPDLMDPALRRPGRFDKKIPFLVPDEDERRAIFEVMIRRYLWPAPSAPLFAAPEPAVAATAGWTGAELEAAVVKAYELREDEKLEGPQAILEAVKRLSPSTSDIEFMTNIAIAECNDSDLLPAAYRNRLNDRKTLEAAIAAQRPTRQRGERDI